MNTIAKVFGNTTLVIAMLTVMALAGAGYVAGASYGYNSVKVEKCVGLANGVNITRFGNSYSLINGCKDAGHGKRNYTYTCNYAGGYGYGYNPDGSSSAYVVSWQPCGGFGYGYGN